MAGLIIWFGASWWRLWATHGTARAYAEMTILPSTKTDIYVCTVYIFFLCTKDIFHSWRLILFKINFDCSNKVFFIHIIENQIFVNILKKILLSTNYIESCRYMYYVYVFVKQCYVIQVDWHFYLVAENVAFILVSA